MTATFSKINKLCDSGQKCHVAAFFLIMLFWWYVCLESQMQRLIGPEEIQMEKEAQMSDTREGWGLWHSGAHPPWANRSGTAQLQLIAAMRQRRTFVLFLSGFGHLANNLLPWTPIFIASGYLGTSAIFLHHGWFFNLEFFAYTQKNEGNELGWNAHFWHLPSDNRSSVCYLLSSMQYGLMY